MSNIVKIGYSTKDDGSWPIWYVTFSIPKTGDKIGPFGDHGDYAQRISDSNDV